LLPAIVLLSAGSAWGQADGPGRAIEEPNSDAASAASDKPTGQSDAADPTQPAAEAEAGPIEIPECLKNPRATMAHFLKAAAASDYAQAAECLDLSRIARESRKSQGEDMAWKLKAVLDRLALVRLDQISDRRDGPPYRFQPDPQVPPIVISGSRQRPWRFTPGTVDSIGELYEQLKDRPPLAGRHWLRDLFPDRLKQTGFLLPHYQWISLLVVIFLGMLVDQLLRFGLNRLTAGWLKLARVEVDRRVERGLWKPVGLLAMALTWYEGTKLIGLPPRVLEVLLLGVHFFAVVAAVWTAFRLIDLLADYLLRKARRTATRFDDLLIPLISRSLKVFAVAIGVLMFAETFNLPLAGLLSGLGIGGLALALAAKETLGNLFGSLTVLVDRPFEIGDWIKTDNVEGTVEAVGMRSTRVRTFYNSLITVPNSLLTTALVDNMGRRRYRRIKTMLSLQYDTPPEKIDAFCEGIRELIRRHPYTRRDYYHVYFNQFSGSSLDVLLYCFVECPDWAVELRERHRLFGDILRLAAELGVAFAFPTQTVHLYQEESAPPEAPPPGPGDAIRLGRRLAAGIAGELLSPQERPGPVEFTGASGEDELDR